MPERVRVCPVHGKPGVVIFRCCLGAIGGASKSRRKRKSSKANLVAMREKRTAELDRRAASLKKETKR